jgi:glutamine amidotransferase
MCRLYGFRANELTKVECSLVHAQNALLAQSRNDERGREHADGWGVACYGDLSLPTNRLPSLVRHQTAAFDDDHFSYTAETIYAETVIAHVRLATVGYVGPLNSHPFTHDDWAFAHNGTLPGFEELQAEMARESGRLQDNRLGDTDSEQFFLWMLNRFARDGIDLEAPNAQAVRASLESLIIEIDQRCRALRAEQAMRLSFVLTNGRQMFASRWNNSLFYLEREGIHDCEICGIPHIRHDESTVYHAVLFASEPITEEHWKAMPEQSLAVVDDTMELSFSDLSAKVKS